MIRRQGAAQLAGPRSKLANRSYAPVGRASARTGPAGWADLEGTAPDARLIASFGGGRRATIRGRRPPRDHVEIERAHDFIGHGTALGGQNRAPAAGAEARPARRCWKSVSRKPVSATAPIRPDLRELHRGNPEGPEILGSSPAHHQQLLMKGVNSGSESPWRA